MTQVIESVRWRVLRCLALVRDHVSDEFVPLFEGDWEGDSRDDVWLAAEEAAKVGDVEFHDLRRSTDPSTRMIVAMRGGREAMVRITDQGYAALKAHDLIGELSQGGVG